MIEFRVTGRARDGGTITRTGDDRDELERAIVEHGYSVERVEWRTISEWSDALHAPVEP